MKSYPMRCKHCGSLLDAVGGMLHRLWHGQGELLACTHCSKSSTRADAVMMGYSFGRWVDRFLDQLVEGSGRLATITQAQASDFLGQHNPDRLRALPSIDMLCNYLTHMFRPVLLEQAHGRDVELDVVALGGEEEERNPATQQLGTSPSGIGAGHQTRGNPVTAGLAQPGAGTATDHTKTRSGKPSGTQRGNQDGVDGGAALVGILGRVEDEHGVREWEAVFARVGPAQFIAYAPAASEGRVGLAMQRRGRVQEAAAAEPATLPRPAQGASVGVAS